MSKGGENDAAPGARGGPFEGAVDQRENASAIRLSRNTAVILSELEAAARAAKEEGRHVIASASPDVVLKLCEVIREFATGHNEWEWLRKAHGITLDPPTEEPR